MPPNAYNTLPVGGMSAYSQQQQQQIMAANSRLSAHNSSSHGSLALLQQQQQQLQQQQQPMRSESQLSFNSASKMPIYEERHYQNIQLYQLNPRTGSPVGPGAGSSIPGAGGGPRTMHHGSHSSLQPEVGHINPSSSASSSHFGGHNRPVSALVTSREQELVSSSLSGQQQYGQLQSKPGGPLDARQRDLMRQEAKMEEIREELRRREDRGASGGGGGPNSTVPYLTGTSSAIPRQGHLGPSSSTSQLAKPKDGRGQLVNGGGSGMGGSMSMMGMSMSMMAGGGGGSSGASSATLLRSGATQQYPSQQLGQQYPLSGNTTSGGGGRLGGSSGGGPPPAPAPKPTRPTSSTASTLAHSSGSLQPQSSGASISSQPMTQVSYRYGPSGYPAAATAAQPAPTQTTTKPTSLLAPSGGGSSGGSQRTTSGGGSASPSPWEREEKEKVRKKLILS